MTDLSTLKVEKSKAGDEEAVPSALDRLPDILAVIKSKKPALFLDYDGTLTPIVDDPEKALLSESMRETLVEVADRFPVAVISGRDLPDVQKLVGIEGIYYAGSHGFDLAGPGGMKTGPEKGETFLPALDAAEKELQEKLDSGTGARVERKKFSIAVHYRKVTEPKVESVKQTVKAVARLHQDLRMAGGKKIFELQPKTDWHKGKALLWLLSELDLDNDDVVPFYIGDDVTDEDAFRSLENRGIGIVVMEPSRSTAAAYRLSTPREVERFLKEILSAHRGESR